MGKSIADAGDGGSGGPSSGSTGPQGEFILGGRLRLRVEERGSTAMAMKTVGKDTPFSTQQTNTLANDDRQAAYHAAAKEAGMGLDPTEEGAMFGQGHEELAKQTPTAYSHPKEAAMAPEGDTRRGEHVKPTNKSPFPGGGW